MATGLNRVLALGNLGADPELRSSVLKFRLACGERYKDREGNYQDRTEWISCVVFGRRADALANLMRKGDRVLVEGSLRTSSYDDRDGNKRYRTEVVAREVILNGAKTSEPRQSGAAAEPAGGQGFGERDYGGDDDIPF